MANNINLSDYLFKKYYKPRAKNVDIETFFTFLNIKLEDYIKNIITKHGHIKTLFTLNVVMKKYSHDEGYTYIDAYFQSAYRDFPIKYGIKKTIQEMFQKIICSFDCYTKQGSGWTLSCINYLEVNSILIVKSINHLCTKHDKSRAGMKSLYESDSTDSDECYYG